MVFTNSLETFAETIRLQKQKEFWRESSKYQRFSPEISQQSVDDLLSSAPPGTFDDAEDELIGMVQRHDNTCWCRPGQIKSSSDRLDCNSTTEEEAIEYAKKNKYQTFLKLPTGHTYYFRDKVGRGRTYDEIQSEISIMPNAQTWIIKF